LNKKQAGNNESDAESSQAEGCAVPTAAGIEERNKRGQHGVADAAERQAHAVRRDAAKHMTEGQMLAVNHRHRRLAVGNNKAKCAQDNGEQSERAQAPHAVEDDAEGRADGHCAVGADAVKGDDFGRALLACAGNAPKSGPGGTQALANAEHQAAYDQNRKAEPVDIMESPRQNEHGTAGCAGGHTPKDRNFGTSAVRNSTGPGAAGQGCYILNADDKPGQHRAVSHSKMDVGRQNGER